MMLAAEELRVVLVTTHVPLRSVPELVTTERVVRTGQIAAAAPSQLVGHRDAASRGLCPESPRG
jgi:4-hydroxythreonine-4-phosphate dehydrogenase